MTDFLVTRDYLVTSVDFVKEMHSRHSHHLVIPKLPVLSYIPKRHVLYSLHQSHKPHT